MVVFYIIPRILSSASLGSWSGPIISSPETLGANSRPDARRSSPHRCCSALAFMVLAAQRSELRHGAANLFQQRPRAVPLAPAFDVGPVELFALHAHHGAHIVPVLRARPAQFPNDHVLSRGEKDLPAIHGHGDATQEPFLVVRVLRETEDLDLEQGPGHAKLLPLRAGIRFEGQLRFRFELWPKGPGERLIQRRAQLDHEVRVLRRARDAVVVAGKPAHQHERDTRRAERFRNLQRYVVNRHEVSSSLRFKTSRWRKISRHSSSEASGFWLRMPASVIRQAPSKSCCPANIFCSSGIARASRNSSRYNSSISRCVSGGGA